MQHCNIPESMLSGSRESVTMALIVILVGMILKVQVCSFKNWMTSYYSVSGLILGSRCLLGPTTYPIVLNNLISYSGVRPSSIWIY